MPPKENPSQMEVSPNVEQWNMGIDLTIDCPSLWSEKLNEMLNESFKDALERILDTVILDDNKTHFYEVDNKLNILKCFNKAWWKKGCEIESGVRGKKGWVIIVKDAIFFYDGLPFMTKNALLKGKDWKWHLFIDGKESNNLNIFAEKADEFLSSGWFTFYKCPGRYDNLRDWFNVSETYDKDS